MDDISEPFTRPNHSARVIVEHDKMTGGMDRYSLLHLLYILVLREIPNS